MHQGDALAQEHCPQHGEATEEGGQGGRLVDGQAGGIVHLQAIGQPAYTTAVAIGVGEDHHLRGWAVGRGERLSCHAW